MDERNIDQVIEAYGTLVLRIARSRMATADDAEEVFQEVFITYARKQPVFTDETRARAWFARTTLYHCRKLWRTIGRHMTEPLDSAAKSEAAPASAADDSTLIDLHNALIQLPDKYQKPLVLFYYGGLSTDEIAGVLKIKPNAVRARMTRGRQMLKEMLE